LYKNKSKLKKVLPQWLLGFGGTLFVKSCGFWWLAIVRVFEFWSIVLVAIEDKVLVALVILRRKHCEHPFDSFGGY